MSTLDKSVSVKKSFQKKAYQAEAGTSSIKSQCTLIYETFNFGTPLTESPIYIIRFYNLCLEIDENMGQIFLQTVDLDIDEKVLEKVFLIR